MNAVKITIPSNVYHLDQIITGFLCLKDQGWDVQIENRSKDAGNPFYGLPVLQAEYQGKKLIYDLWDGYQNPEDMRRALAWADVYFKRSFSEEKNRRLFPEFSEKMRPLGLNYHVTRQDDPINEPRWLAAVKTLTGRSTLRYFTQEVFEETPKKCEGEPKILFLAQFWDDNEPGLDPQSRQERREINAMRMTIAHALRERFGHNFIGGLTDTPLARKLAPELVLPKKATARKAYIERMHSADICIGTMGLYESIGWKTAEYVAAAKAIVNERLRYEVPGDFREGVNYLAFTTAGECIDAVEALVRDPERLYAMKKANAQYYQKFLKPDVLVKNTLDQI